jgi:hypothetical protein
LFGCKRLSRIPKVGVFITMAKGVSSGLSVVPPALLTFSMTTSQKSKAPRSNAVGRLKIFV